VLHKQGSVSFCYTVDYTNGAVVAVILYVTQTRQCKVFLLYCLLHKQGSVIFCYTVDYTNEAVVPVILSVILTGQCKFLFYCRCTNEAV
jgi:hypothetical protein